MALVTVPVPRLPPTTTCGGAGAGRDTTSGAYVQFVLGTSCCWGGVPGGSGGCRGASGTAGVRVGDGSGGLRPWCRNPWVRGRSAKPSARRPGLRVVRVSKSGGVGAGRCSAGVGGPVLSAEVPFGSRVRSVGGGNLCPKWSTNCALDRLQTVRSSRLAAGPVFASPASGGWPRAGGRVVLDGACLPLAALGPVGTSTRGSWASGTSIQMIGRLNTTGDGLCHPRPLPQATAAWGCPVAVTGQRSPLGCGSGEQAGVFFDQRVEFSDSDGAWMSVNGVHRDVHGRDASRSPRVPDT